MARLPYVSADSFPPGLPPANMLRMWAHSTATLRPGLALGTACITALSISPFHREALALYCSVKFECEYIWNRHTDDARKAGLTDSHLQALRSHDISNRDVWTEEQMALLAFLGDVIDRPEATDTTFLEAGKWFNEQQIVEIITAQGFYYMWARVATTLRVEPDTGILGDDQKAKQWANDAK
ncbi:hypothetical protein JDV02_008179 [Purpureocillium takamizusanense]|uniref:Carboxymuconolactone decarboxylase-like domain-containing protein n=1 Tax=Purpureocillium takamizusanense TaxID=2060973 RepID=A0A9Q8VEX9_9HYPO|nr:uncharacterized protein JDV02_008179 [Purpureocillium takamizusanense]UNI22277.1 hypothetical protein JDV02_008179 [Purpureocillium takamizusanense]